MKTRRLIVLFSFVFLLGFAVPASAYVPRLVDNSNPTTEIDNPDIAQAFYGELKNSPTFFSIKVDQPMELYISILVPDIPGIKKDKSVRIDYDNNGQTELFWDLKGQDFPWSPWFERFAGNNYFKGPEVTKMAQPGDYTLAVYSPDYTGKYVLLVGEKESFSVTDIVTRIFALPSLNQNFFDRSPWTAYFNLIGLFMLGGLIVIVLLYFVFVSILNKIFKPTEAKKIYFDSPPHDPLT